MGTSAGAIYEDREKLKKKMEATPAHKNYAKWMKTRSSLKSTKQDLQKKLKLGVVLPPTVIKNNCESIFTDNPHLNDDINNQFLDSRVARRLSLVMQLLNHFPRGDFARTPACINIQPKGRQRQQGVPGQQERSQSG